MYKSDVETLVKLVAELRETQKEDLASSDWQERISFKINDYASRIEDPEEQGFRDEIRDLSNYFDCFGLYTTSQETYKQKLEELCVSIERKSKESNINSVYGGSAQSGA